MRFLLKRSHTYRRCSRCLLSLVGCRVRARPRTTPTRAHLGLCGARTSRPPGTSPPARRRPSSRSSTPASIRHTPSSKALSCPGFDFVDDDADRVRPSTGTERASPERQPRGRTTASAASARASRCSVLPLQVVGPGGIALNVNIAEAIDYAVDHGAAVVNISLIGPNSPPRARATRSCEHAPPASSSSPRPATRRRTRPGSRQPSRERSRSELRRTTGGARLSPTTAPWVRFAAPECAPIAVLGGGSGVGCGTSMSAPLVAGIVALMRTQARFASVDDIEGRLARTARAVPGTQFGVPDAAAALRVCSGTPPAPRLRPGRARRVPCSAIELEAFSGIWVGSGAGTVATSGSAAATANCTAISGATRARYTPVRATTAGAELRAVTAVEGVGAAASRCRRAFVGDAGRGSRRGRRSSGTPQRRALSCARTRGRWQGAEPSFRRSSGSAARQACERIARRPVLPRASPRPRLQPEDRGRSRPTPSERVRAVGKITRRVR